MRLLPAIALLIALLWPGSTMGQRHCYPANVLENHLRRKFQEAQTTAALSNRSPATYIEVWISPGGATWTIVELNHHGISCLLRAGENWRLLIVERGEPL